MNGVVVFLHYRERLNHSFIQPKLLLMLMPNSETVRRVLANPKVWFQIKLRVDLMLTLGQEAFSLKSADAFGRIGVRLHSCICEIDEAMKAFVHGDGAVNTIIERSREIKELVSEMKFCSYSDERAPNAPSMEELRSTSAVIQKGFRVLNDCLLDGAEMEGGYDERYLLVGRRYWQTRCEIECALIRILLKQDSVRPMPAKVFWDRLDSVFQTDRLAEEALSTEAARSDRVSEVEKLLIEIGYASTSNLLDATCAQIVRDLDGGVV